MIHRGSLEIGNIKEIIIMFLSRQSDKIQSLTHQKLQSSIKKKIGICGNFIEGVTGSPTKNDSW